METVLGTAQLAQPYGRLGSNSAPTRAHAIELLEHAFDRGIRIVDTAPTYGDAEGIIGESGLDFAVHTKIQPGTSPRSSVERSLRSLQREFVEVLYLHEPSELLDPSLTTIEEASSLVGTHVGQLGVSVYHPEEFDRAVDDPRISVVQVPLNVLDRRIDDRRLRSGATAGTRIIARSVYLQGLLVSPLDQASSAVPLLADAVRRFREVVDQLDRSDQELALGWVMARPGVYGYAVGVDTRGRLDALLESAAHPLTRKELSVLERLEPAADALLDPRRWP